MAEAMILAEVDDRGIATVTLNRPDVHNALNDEVIRRFTRCIRRLRGTG